jgi:hypothetical protein
MTVEITIQVPDELGQELQQVRDRLPEVLARGLREVLAERFDVYGVSSRLAKFLPASRRPRRYWRCIPHQRFRNVRAACSGATSRKG